MWCSNIITIIRFEAMTTSIINISCSGSSKLGKLKLKTGKADNLLHAGSMEKPNKKAA